MIFIRTVILALSTFIIVFQSIASTEWTVSVDGIVTEEYNRRLEGATITLLKNFTRINEAQTGETGKFIFILEPGNDYEIAASKEGYVTKKVLFSTKNVSSQRTKKGFAPFLIEINLFKKRNGLNTSILNRPIGKIRYSSKENDFAVDKEYEKMIEAQLEKLNKDLEVIMKNEAGEKLARQQMFEKSLRNRNETSVTSVHNNTQKVSLISSSLKGNEMKVDAPGRKENKDHTKVRTDTKKNKPEPKTVVSYQADVIRTNRLKSNSGESRNEGEIMMDGGNKIIITRTVLDNGITYQYKKVIHNWGATFFFRNGVPVTEEIFERETIVK